MSINGGSAHPYQFLSVTNNSMQFTSIGMYYDNNDEIIQWGGLSPAGNDDSWYAYEYVNNCWNYTLNCFQFSFGQTMRVLIEHPEDDHPFPIQKWYSEAEKIEM